MSKRQAGNQITKDREEEEEDWGRDGPPDPVEEASAEVLATRKIALPKSRRRNQESTQASEQKTSNPFSFGIPASSGSINETVPIKSNPFASLSKNTPSASTATTTTASTPTFSFGTSAAQAEAKDTTASAPGPAKSGPSEATSASNDDQYDQLLRQRSINVCFKNAVSACLENDAFADLTKICEEYREHWKANKSVPVEPAKNSSGTNIYPSFKSTNTDTANKEEPAKTVEAQKTPSFSFNAAAPSFSFGNSTSSSSAPTFSFGKPTEAEKKSETTETNKDAEQETKAKSSESAEPPSQAPSFNFGQKSTTEAVPPKSSTTFNFGQPSSTFNVAAQDQNPKDVAQAQETPRKPTDSAKSNDFSWTPDRGIKFGDNSKSSETKNSAPTFGFQNPLASPSQASGDQNVSPKPPSTGFSFGSSGKTGFSFGQAAAKPAEEKSEAEPVSKTPAFSFGSSAPTFSFGQSTTPSFSFSAPAKTAVAEDEKSEGTRAANTADAETEGDAMPEEPRTNDALVAGPGAGEEDEDEVYTVPRAKLFKFNSGDATSPWTDLGVCVVRVLVHRETQKARMVARAEGAGALRLNARMYPHFKYTLEGKSNAKVYDLVDAAKTDTYLIKLKEKEAATAFVKVLNERKG